jgi:uncharacterized protein YfaS (alpha-2-macroglobulin family)
MTAYVLYGLATAKEAGYEVRPDVLSRGTEFLTKWFLEDDDMQRMAYEARVLALFPTQHAAIRPLVNGRLFDGRERLAPYGKALLATALKLLGDQEKAGILLDNLESTAKVDEQNGTASWDRSEGHWWYWWNDRVETNAAALQAYAMIRPESRMSRMLARWLVNNRRANTWRSTRDTAMSVCALVEFSRANRELEPDYTLTVDLGGEVRRSYTINRENALLFDNQFVVPDELLRTGSQPLTFTMRGKGTLYYSAYTRYFSLEEPIRSTGSEIFVRRRYYRLEPNTAAALKDYAPVDSKRPNPFLTGRYQLLDDGGEWEIAETSEPQYVRTLLEPGATLSSGDLLEVELLIESKNDYEYLVFEDLKPAGCEPQEVRSGGHAGSGLWSNMELRDQKVAFFLTSLPQGTRTLTYRLRAEIPGQFHVLPTNGYAMYAPDIRTLSDEMTLSIHDQE